MLASDAIHQAPELAIATVDVDPRIGFKLRNTLITRHLFEREIFEFKADADNGTEPNDEKSNSH